MISKIINGITRYYNDNGKYLMSYSTMSKPFTQDKFDNIPSFIFEKATKFGSDMSNLIVDAFGGKEIGKYTPEHLKCLKSLVNALKTLNVKPTTIEKHVWNDKWHGYLDIDCENCFIEVKTRSKLELELNTVIQCEIYKRITGKDYYIIYLNKKTGAYECWGNEDINIEEKSENLIREANDIIDSFEYLWEKLV